MNATTLLAIKNAQLVVNYCAEIPKGANVMVLCDKDRWQEGEIIAGTCYAAGAHTLLVDVSIEVMLYHQEHKRPAPPKHLYALMMNSDYCFAVADCEYCHYLGHTDEYLAAQRNGCRTIFIEEYMSEWNTSREDIDKIVTRTNLFREMLDNAETVRITTKKGTDVTCYISKGRPAMAFVPKGGKKGEIAPNYAEAAIAPLEWTAHGNVVVDGIVAGHGEMSGDPLHWVIEKGRIVSVSGGANADKFREFLASSGENAEAIAECGICTSHTEKRLAQYGGRPSHWAIGASGSVHLGIGHNQTIFGEIRSQIHVDCQIYDCTVYIGETQVMDNGRYLY